MSSWAIDTTHSEVGFWVRHMVISKVRGQFRKWTATVTLPGDDLTAASVEATIDTASIDTREEQRDGHLRSADFLDVDKHPSMTFKSTRVERSGDAYAVHGELTLHGVTRPVTLATSFLGRGKDPWGNDRLGFHAEAQIDRREFGLGWNQALELGGVLVGETIHVEIEAQLVAAKPAT